MITHRRAGPEGAEAVAAVCRASFRVAVPTAGVVHSDDLVRTWIAGHASPKLETWVAVDDGTIVALMALEPCWIEQLDVAPSRTGDGIGAGLLGLAKQRATGSLELQAFQLNAGAALLRAPWARGDRAHRWRRQRGARAGRPLLLGSAAPRRVRVTPVAVPCSGMAAGERGRTGNGLGDRLSRR